MQNGAATVYVVAAVVVPGQTSGNPGHYRGTHGTPRPGYRRPFALQREENAFAVGTAGLPFRQVGAVNAGKFRAGENSQARAFFFRL